MDPQTRSAVPSEQSRKLLLALGILLLLLVGVLVKDRQFWFGDEQSTIESDMPATTQTASPTPVQPTTQHATQPVHGAKKQSQGAATGSKAASQSMNEAATEEAPIVATDRTALPPLDVEVVAGDTHRAVHPGSNAKNLEIGDSNLQSPTSAIQREPVTAAAILPQASLKGYPVLAQHMNVQGSVILQAVISSDGMVQDLKVLSGPAILATAAQQAVREWRFKPMLQNGRAVESKARITVNFSIRVADGSAKTTLADSRGADHISVWSR